MRLDKKTQILGLVVVSVAIGVIVGIAVVIGLNFSNQEAGSKQPGNSGEKEALYWVAPMDPNYRRDEPGQSPMGMDLIPVYKEDASDEHGPGVVRISPDVVHNLGVRLVQVKEDVLHSEIKTVGYVKYDEDQLKHIHPRVEGWIEKLYVKAAGDPIRQGQPLYELYAPELVNAQEEYLLALNSNNQSLITAAENRLKALQLSKAFIQRLKRKRKVQQSITFNAPQNGVVDNLNIREGFFVKPGTTLMSIGKLDQVWVEAEIFERQASSVKKGLPVSMTLDYLQGRQWQGEVDYVYPTLDPKTRTLRVRLRFDNDDLALKPNMFAEVKISIDTQERFLLVPKEAVIRTAKHNVVVLALGEGRFKSVAVRTARSDETHIAITQGLSVQDKVVVAAQFLLDSESSKTSDFKRMHHADDKDNQGQSPMPNNIPNSVWVEGKVKSIDHGSRQARIEHAKIAAWSWPVMTMKFRFADDVDITALQNDSAIHMQLSKQADGSAVITKIHISAKKKPESEPAPVDHSKHDMSH